MTSQILQDARPTNYADLAIYKGYFSHDDFHAWATCNGQDSKE